MSDATLPARSSTMSTTFRVVAGIICIILGFALAVLLIAAIGGPEPGSVMLGWPFLLAGFAGLGISRVTTAPLRPMTMALSIALMIAILLLVALPWPPHGVDAGSFLALSIGIALSIVALSLGSRSPRVTIVALLTLAVYGAFILIRIGTQLAAMKRRVPLEHFGPAGTLAYVIGESLGIAWIAALWHGRSLLPSLRSRVSGDNSARSRAATMGDP